MGTAISCTPVSLTSLMLLAYDEGTDDDAYAGVDECEASGGGGI